MENTTAGALPSDRWWAPIAVLVALVPVGIVGALFLPPDAFTSLLFLPVTIPGFVLTVLSPVFVHYDRRYLRATADWTPSDWYYLMILPPLSLVLPAMYLVQRHRHVGVP